MKFKDVIDNFRFSKSIKFDEELCKVESIKFTKNFPKYRNWKKRIWGNDRSSTKN